MYMCIVYNYCCYFIVSIISVPPVDTTGCYNNISTFYCESNRSNAVMSWLINSNSITEQVKQTRGITINNDTSLSIMGLPINNGITIGCIVAVTTPSLQIDSAGAIFTVTDIPPVEDLTIVFDNDIMTSTWSQPSCVPLNYSYQVNIDNDTLIVTNTTLQYTVYSCQNYTVSVTVMDTELPQYHSDTINGSNETGIIGGKLNSFESTILFASVCLYFNVVIHSY